MENQLTIAEVRGQIGLLQGVMKSIMIKDVHYGVIPGCKKPSLYKPGSEIILTTFKLTCEPIVEDLSTEDESRYRVTARITYMTSGMFVGAGIGECSSKEDKYQWRTAVHEDEYGATDEFRRREKYKRDGTTYKQVRTNPSDIANTILKMAKKRAQIDATLTATAASDIFEQDIEDLPKEMQEDIAKSQPATKPDVEPPKAKSTNNGDVISEAQGKRFYAISKGAGKSDDEIKEFLRFNYELESSKDIPKSKYAEICEEVAK